MDWGIFAVLAVITLVAAFLQGLSSFGFPLFAVPLFSFLLPVQVAVPITTLLCLAANLSMLREIPGVKPIKKQAITVMITSFITVPLGVFALKYLDTSLLKIILGIAIILCVIPVSRGIAINMKRPVAWSSGVGLICGFLAGLANSGGPVLILYLNNLHVNKKEFRGFIVLMFVSIGCMTTLITILNGLITPTVLWYALYLLPVPFVGTWLGTKVSARVNEALFKKITLAFLILTSLSILISGITGLK